MQPTPQLTALVPLTSVPSVTLIPSAEIKPITTLLVDARDLQHVDDDTHQMAELLLTELWKYKHAIVTRGENARRPLNEDSKAIKAAQDEATGFIGDAIGVLTKTVLAYTDRKKADAKAAKRAAEEQQRKADEQRMQFARKQEERDREAEELAEKQANQAIAGDILRRALKAGDDGISMPPDDHHPILAALSAKGLVLTNGHTGRLVHADYRASVAAAENVGESYWEFPGEIEPADLSPLPGVVRHLEPGESLRVVDAPYATDEPVMVPVHFDPPPPVDVSVPKSSVHGRVTKVLIVDDESKIPYRATQGGEPLMGHLKAPITRALKAGLSVPGCRLEEKRTAVRR